MRNTLKYVCLAATALIMVAVPQAAFGQNVPAYPRGIVITSVVPNSTAAQVNLRSGEIITRVNDYRVTEVLDFVERLRRANGSARLSVFDPTTQQFRFADVWPDRNGLIGVFGISTDRLNHGPSASLVVTGVNPGSAAHLAGITPGDVIVTVNGFRVVTITDFVTAMALNGRIASITYLGAFDGRIHFVTVPADPFGRIGAFLVTVAR